MQADATCREETAFLDRYLSSGLNERQRARFESHLAMCGDCVAFLKTYKATIELTRSFLTSEVSSTRSSELLRKRRLRRRFSQ
jgi:anti-sigma factor RsiW